MAKEQYSSTIITFFLFFLSLFLVSSSSSSATRHDMINPPTVFPTNPTTTPVTTPSTAPVTVPPVLTNPVTTYPTPVTTVPAVSPPVVTNAPALPGQSWCVARPGTSQVSLQEALDFACGAGGADCSQIQQGGNCYIPNTIQNHASFAFNSYYQKNPSPQSCDFGGAAAVVNTNPSSGSCIYQLFSPTSSTTPTPTPSNPIVTQPATPTPSTQTVTQPATPTPPTTTTTTPTGGGIIGSATPPPVFNPANPLSSTPTNPASGTTSAYGYDGSPTTGTTSESTGSGICFDHVLVATSLLAGLLVLWK
ncbi:PREDICTED: PLASMODESMATA CALLOSE-BINDING PROTEIN 4 [Tarenaya hassleriana]|uniref:PLASMODESMATA CALLOSE-BINDING PROTEIN 4 n=1 Tax=Tarenaya hassleriana TaxID=28532 RepID=UPI00053C480A|nr:PREDICTED: PLASMODESMATA CALLOSE-BINDING PROTEIN 4 [Tarenaya hassleriana]